MGTVAVRGVVTGGRVLQGSVYTRLERGDAARRLPWSHYLARPSVIQAVGRFDPDDVVAGFFAESGPESTLDLGALSERVIGQIQMSPRLDHVAPFRSRRTRLRWALCASGAPSSGVRGEFTVADDSLRTLRVTFDGAALPAVVEFCEDLALHDWVLTVLLQLVERSGIGSSDGPATLVRLRPAIDHLLHLWMPGARTAAPLLPLWESLERRPGFTRQWQATVSRVRDQLAVHTLDMLRHLWSAAPERAQNGGGFLERQR